VLELCPELIPELFPEQWRLLKESSYLGQVEITLRAEEIDRGFSRLMWLPLNYCFCFFIDGLDEYEETIQCSHRGLANKLDEWTLCHPDSVKICVSSREWNAFLDIAPDERRLRLQELTKGDIESYVQGQLRDVAQSEGKRILISAIVEKAQGVFLWVAVVTKSIRDRFEDGFGVSTVIQELDYLPDELESLFRHILITKKSKLMRRMAFRTFSMVRARTRGHGIPLTLGMYYFMEHYQEDPEFAIKLQGPPPGFQEPTPSLTEKARKTLIGCCGGLVEPADKFRSLCFTHRSVPEFLDQQDIKREMYQHTENFSAVDALSQLFLASLLHARWLTCDDDMFQNHSGMIVRDLILERARTGLDNAPFPFLESIQRAMSQLGWKEWPDEDPCETECPGYSGYNFMHNLTTADPIRFPIHLCAALGHTDYVSWKIQHDPKATDSFRKYGFLMALAGCGYRAGPLKLAQTLLDHGLAPATVIHSGYGSFDRRLDEELTFWQGFIYCAVRVDKDHLGDPDRRTLGHLIQLFLDKGADPELRISNNRWNYDELVHTGEAISKFGGYKFAFRNDIFYREYLPGPIWDFISARTGVISLVDLVEFWDLPNKDTILETIQTRMQPCMAEEERKPTSATDSETDSRSRDPYFNLSILLRPTIVMLLGKRTGSLQRSRP
jgi:hypothetical protein